MFLGRYEIHHRRDNGLITDRVCSKCKTKFNWITHLFGLNYYHTNANRDSKKKKLQELIHSGSLKNRYPMMGPFGMYATTFASLLPKWSRPVRIFVAGLVIGFIIIGILKIF